jgi:hypothetical protein
MSHESGSVIASVSGDSVEIDQSAVRNVEGERVELRQAAAQHVRGENMDVAESAVLSVHAADIHMQDCASFAVVGEHVRLKESGVVFLFARSVEGDVKNAITPAAAFAFGLGAVAGIGIWRRLRRR